MEEFSNFADQLARLHFASNTRTQAELAAFFEVRQSTVSRAVRRGKIPADWLLVLLRVKGVFPEWILTGAGPCYAAAPAGRYATADETTGRRVDVTALRHLSSRLLADELVRRIVLAESKALLSRVADDE